jgi:hypothetical protein
MSIVVLAAAVVLAIIANVFVYLIVTGPLGEPLIMCSNCDLTPPVLSAMDVDEPILFSIVLGVGAVVVYAVISAISSRPLRVFAIVATVLLFVSLGAPAYMPSPPIEWSAKLTLMAMHVVGFSMILGTIWFGHRRGWLTSQKGRSDSRQL